MSPYRKSFRNKGEVTPAQALEVLKAGNRRYIDEGINPAYYTDAPATVRPPTSAARPCPASPPPVVRPCRTQHARPPCSPDPNDPFHTSHLGTVSSSEGRRSESDLGLKNRRPRHM